MKVHWRDIARDDLYAIAAYIAQDNPRAAARTIDRIEARVGQLSDFPDSGRPSRGDMRELVVPGTPYVVVYRRTPATVEILSVLHGARDR